MYYELIFYHSGKTAEIEKAISDEWKNVSLNQKRSCAAADPKELVHQLSHALKRSELILIIGGLDGGIQSTDHILLEVLSSDKNKIKQETISDDHWYASILTCRNQTIIMLPDDTIFVTDIIGGKIKKMLKENYSLTETESNTPSIETVSNELERQLSSKNRVRLNINSSTAEKRELSKLHSMKIGIIILAILGFIQLSAAAYIILTNYLI